MVHTYLSHVHIFIHTFIHSQDEAGLLTGVDLAANPPTQAKLKDAAGKLLDGGVGVVAITLGEAGAYVAVTSKTERVKEGSRLAHQAAKWIGQDILLPPFPLAPNAEVKAYIYHHTSYHIFVSYSSSSFHVSFIM